MDALRTTDSALAFYDPERSDKSLGANRRRAHGLTARFATLVAAIVTGQMMASLILDHFGWVGFPQQSITPTRFVGALLVIGGVLLIQRR